MSQASSVKFIETALFATGSFSLSYTHPDQKWVIRTHILSLLQEFPSFKVSIDTFTHNNGNSVNLLCLHGDIRFSDQSPKLPSIPLTIWVHENYPYFAPILFVNPLNLIVKSHPFVDSTGFTDPTYIKTWIYPGCNLLELIGKLVKIFKKDHPFIYSSYSSSSMYPPNISKIEALDRLTGIIHYDILAMQKTEEEEINVLWELQTEMRRRVEVTNLAMCEFEREKERLKEKVARLEGDCDVLTNWVRANDLKRIEADSEKEGVENVYYEGADDESNIKLDSLASFKAIEDVICALDKGFEVGILSIDSYMRQVRNLFREQFFYRANLVEFENVYDFI